MLKVENIDVWGFEHALRGMRNPLNSWDKSDSFFGDITGDADVGENDLLLMKKLYKAGTEHRKYLRQIFVSMDIIAPRYWWLEADTYKVGVTKNSCSTMHTLHKQDLTLADFSHEYLTVVARNTLQKLIDVINSEREVFTGQVAGFLIGDKQCWYNMVQLLPASFNQKATITMNYENVVTIIKQRTGHKLDEWNDFVNVLKKLPYIAEIMGD